MKPVNINVKFLLNLSKIQTIIARIFDEKMGNGIGFNEFLILFHLNQSDGQKMRRVDLADKIGITASGITRMLLPMEKIGLIKSGLVNEDARVRIVSLSPGGKQKLDDALEDLGFFLEDIFSKRNEKEVKAFSDLLVEIGGKLLMG